MNMGLIIVVILEPDYEVASWVLSSQC